MATRKRKCATCGGQFEYEIARGSDRLYCAPSCRPPSAIRLCAVDVCGKETRGRKYCEMHYYRMRRKSTLDAPSFKHRYDHSNGYVLILAPGHRLADSRGRVYEHRKVFYDANGEGPFNCHVCGVCLTWDDLHVDHLDDDRTHNDVSNLAPACEVCNPWRSKDKAVATRRERHARWIEFNGERLTLTDWAQRLGIAPTNVAARLERWPLERALTEPRGRFGPKSCHTRKTVEARAARFAAPL